MTNIDYEKSYTDRELAGWMIMIEKEIALQKCYAPQEEWTDPSGLFCAENRDIVFLWNSLMERMSPQQGSDLLQFIRDYLKEP